MRPARGLGSAEGRLVEGPELAAVELVARQLELVDRGDADAQMLGDGAFVEAVGLARQLDLAMDRLVRDAEQGAVRHAETEALGGERRRFHVDRDRAALAEAQRRTGVA